MADLQSWESFAVMIGGASAALTGLLFVAVSLNRDQIAGRPELRASAAQTLMLLVLPLPICALLLTPDQSDRALGTELTIIAVVAAVLLAVAGRRKRTTVAAESSRLARLVDRRWTNLITTAFLLTGGVSQLADGGGLRWLVPAVLFALLAGVLNAWIFLIAEAKEV